jgi:predicted TPR repeat methyltransferase
VLDLGCGTGLCGLLLRPIARKLEGLDLSRGMIEMARQRGIYDDLNVGEIVSGLRARSAACDLVVAGDVFCYLGDLTAVFAAAAIALRPEGWFAFSVEESDTPDWVLRASRRYAHHHSYIRHLASQFGFDLIQVATQGLRKEAGKDLPGLVVVLRRSAGNA